MVKVMKNSCNEMKKLLKVMLQTCNAAALKEVNSCKVLWGMQIEARFESFKVHGRFNIWAIV